jgi:amino acid transporter
LAKAKKGLKNMKKVALFLAVFALVVAPQLALAAANIEPGLNMLASPLGLGTRDLRETIASIINVAMGLLGIVAVLIILLGGFKWMTAMGNDENIKKAKSLIIAGVIGLIIILTAYAIATFVVNSILRAV